MLHLTNATKQFTSPTGEKLDILRGVSLVVQEGTSTAILGRSGSGKSTLLAGLGLLDTFDGGSYSVCGTEVSTLSERELATLRSERIGFVYQRFFLLRHLTAYENIETALLHGSPVSARRRRRLVRQSLDAVGLADRGTHRPGQLSGGEQQRVAIARAMVRRPAVILADEPTGALDEQTAETVLSLLLDVTRRYRTALVIVTHDPDVAARADYVMRLAEGRWISG